MRPGLRRFLIIFISLLVIIFIAAGAIGYSLPGRSYPQTSGEIHLAGLNGPVDIYRDAYGIPQVYASTSHDLFFAQGYLHAQDRFWQMDFWRHIGSGRLAEMFGKSEVSTDRFLRTLGWARVAQQEIANLDPTTSEILQAYSDGVNAYLKDHQGTDLSLEYSVLKVINPGYQVEQWTPLNTLTWAKVMSWDLGGNMDSEIEQAILLKTLDKNQMADLFPPYPSDHPIIVPKENTSSGLNTPAEADQALAGSLSANLISLSGQVKGLDDLLGGRAEGIGSNNWVISGKRTSTGKPFLANDPHLAAQMPSIWYEIGLHCTTKNDACPYEVTGFSFAGAPGVIIGHNDRIAWGVTNVNPDVQDLYIEKINPENPNQYEVNGKWMDMQLIKETIQVGGGSPEELTIRYTRHGPVVSDTYEPLAGFGKKAGIDLPPQYALALQWTALQPNELFRAVWKMDQAKNWNDFREGAKDWAAPSQNLVYADVDGNIGYQTPGLVPIRASGDGSLPVPGWTDQYEWTGYIPFDKLPFAYNPPQGYIATANNAVVGSDYPYLLTTGWDLGFRARRIVDMIEQAPGPIDAAYIQKMQGDDKNLIAENLVPILLQIQLEDSHIDQARSILKGWDFQARMDSAPAALFEVFWRHLLIRTFQDKLPKDYWPGGSSDSFEVVRRLAQQPNSAWWDIRSTPQVEQRDDTFRLALGDAVSELDKLQGNDPTKWTWGSLHTLTLLNQTLGKSGIGPIEALFNRGAYQTAGGSSIVNATGWDASSAAGNPYQVLSLPSMRMIVDLSNLSESQSVITTGQSGHAYNPHYADETDLWRNIQYHPMLWDDATIKSAPGGHLILAP